jgi:hypothetical protein
LLGERLPAPTRRIPHPAWNSRLRARSPLAASPGLPDGPADGNREKPITHAGTPARRHAGTPGCDPAQPAATRSGRDDAILVCHRRAPCGVPADRDDGARNMFINDISRPLMNAVTTTALTRIFKSFTVTTIRVFAVA